MSDTQDHAARLTETLNASLAPVRQHLATIEAEIETKEAELGDLRKLRMRAQSIVRAIDPDAPRPGPKRGATKPTRAKHQNVAPEYAEAVGNYLRENYNGDDLVAADLFRDDEFVRATKTTGSDPQRITRALHVLHAQGVIRLDRKFGNKNIYRVNPTPAGKAGEDAAP